VPTRDDPTLTIRFTTEELVAIRLRAKGVGKKPGTWIREVVREVLETGRRPGDGGPLATATADLSVESVTLPRRAAAARPSRAPAVARTLLEVTKAEIAADLGIPVTAPVVGTKALARIRRAGDDPGRAV
jgi:hypothetical protein